jgi:hypothetical protein
MWKYRHTCRPTLPRAAVPQVTTLLRRDRGKPRLVLCAIMAMRSRNEFRGATPSSIAGEMQCLARFGLAARSAADNGAVCR